MTTSKVATGAAPGHRPKRALDVGLSLVTLPVTLPAMALLAVVVKASSRGPVLYRARRVGRDMVPFEVLKFRTMVHKTSGPGITRSADPRITRTGRWLRTMKLDELPQIINVLRGEMSLVGPRPEDPRFVACYTEEQRRVFVLRPGLTSPAYLYFGDEQALIERSAAGDVEQFYLASILPLKLEIELRYLTEWSFLGDLRIIGCTLLRLCARMTSPNALRS